MSGDLHKKLALSLVSLALAAGALEAGARAWLPLPAPVLMRDRIYLNPLPLVNGRPAPPAPSLKGPPLKAEKDPGEIRVFVFGESSAEGIP